MISQNIKKIKTRISSVEHNQNVQIVAVSKTRSPLDIQSAFAAGQKHFGENYLQEALTKINYLKNKDIVWHFIGPIQSNKTAKIAKHFHWVHSVDRIKIAKRLNDKRSEKLAPLKILLQINIDDETSKSGFRLEDVDYAYNEIKKLNNIHLRGLMCIPKKDNSDEAFAKMAKLIKNYKELDTLSMGMSKDLELAVKNGATFIRVGTDIFGKRL